MDNGFVLPAIKYYLEPHGKYVFIVNIENNVKNILKISYSEGIQIVKEKQELSSKSNNRAEENDNKNKFSFFGCLGIIQAERINFLVIVSDAEIVSYLFNRAIYRVKKISFIQLNDEIVDNDNPNDNHYYQYEICRLGANGGLTSLNNSRKENKKFFCNKSIKTQNCFDNIFKSRCFLVENCVYNYNKLHNNNETYVHKFKNSTLKKDTLKTIACFVRAFNKGPFYFSYYYNLTTSLQKNFINESKKANENKKTDYILSTRNIKVNDTHYTMGVNCREEMEAPFLHKLKFNEINQEYTWNWKFLNHFIHIDGFDFVVFLVHGYMNSNILHVCNRKIKLYLISRKNKNRSGVRFWCRGGNSQGDVANFVETEQIVVCKNSNETHVFSYIIVRGSIPVLWKQQPTLSIRPKIQICSEMHENAKILNLHMEKLKNTYGKISITNLINKRFGEKYLGQCFENCLKECNVEHNYTWFDFHGEFKKLNYNNLYSSLKTVIDDLNDFSYFSFSLPNSTNCSLSYDNDDISTIFPSWESAKVNNFQKGIFRVNCIDCLDRTNVFQSFLAKYILYIQLKSINIKLEQGNLFPFYFFKSPQDELKYRKIWIHNANAISTIYSGAGALKNDITQNGKRTMRGLIQDLYHIVLRYINNNFLDGYNNDCIHLVTNENLKHLNVFNIHKGKYNQMMQVLFEFIAIFSTSACTSPMQKLLKGFYYFSHNITSTMISQCINYAIFIIRKNFHFFLFPYNQAKYLQFISLMAKTSGILSTSFLIFVFFCIYVFTQRRRVISSPKLGTP
ncbi:phosphoinositide phosphatase SAC1 [Plasmodium gonderi]|uniref:Phosphoinositide phosphatase SAC1 n=1 Tax=Plasmodium gonderi TaxID=77519 RepID=A0A1Y1JLM5_PLAGO|nr:phosphoinositide phosphatase SAC1 [Plasmodium gonderi]GAW81712.1 phosphoinositide phosphatase SAC1 [Plasmodium gonderi]